jgi:hypothetical protein
LHGRWQALARYTAASTDCSFQTEPIRLRHPSGLQAAQWKSLNREQHRLRQRSGMSPGGADSVVQVVPTERHVMLNLNAARRRPLFESARALIGDEEPRGPALIVAQAAVEVACETMIDFAMQMRQVYDPLRQWAAAVSCARGRPITTAYSRSGRR